jgi:hypothetical protein
MEEVSESYTMFIRWLHVNFVALDSDYFTRDINLRMSTERDLSILIGLCDILIHGVQISGPMLSLILAETRIVIGTAQV